MEVEIEFMTDQSFCLKSREHGGFISWCNGTELRTDQAKIFRRDDLEEFLLFVEEHGYLVENIDILDGD